MDETPEGEQSTPLPHWAESFFEARVKPMTVAQAAMAAGVSRQMIYFTRDKNAAFAKLLLAAKEQIVDDLEDNSIDRAINGERQKRYDKDGREYQVVEFNPTREIFLLKNLRPEQYNHAAGQRKVGDQIQVGPEVRVNVTSARAVEESGDGSADA